MRHLKQQSQILLRYFHEILLKIFQDLKHVKQIRSSRSAASATSIPNRASARLSSQTARSECKVEASGAKSTRQKTARSEASSSMLSSTSTRLLESHKKGVEKEVQLLRRRLQLIDEAIAGAESRIEE